MAEKETSKPVDTIAIREYARQLDMGRQRLAMKDEAERKADSAKSPATKWMEQSEWGKNKLAEQEAERKEQSVQDKLAAEPRRGVSMGPANDFTGDLMRVMGEAGTLGGYNYLESGMSKIPSMLGFEGLGKEGLGYSAEEGYKESDAARARTGVAGDVAAGVGKIAPYFMLPEAMFATAPRALLAGGTVNVASDVVQSELETGKMPSMAQIAVDFGLGSLGSTAGFFLGKFIQGAQGARPNISSETAKALETLQAQESKFAQIVDDPKVVVNNTKLDAEVNGLLKRIQGDRNMKVAFNTRSDMSKLTRKAIGELKALTKGKTHPTFGYVTKTIDKIRNSIRNQDKEITAPPLDAQMVDMIADTMDRYMLNLGKTRVINTSVGVKQAPQIGPQGQAFSALGLKEAQESYRGLLGIKGLQRKTAITLGVLKRAAQRERGGEPLDKAVQEEFARLMTHDMKTGKQKAYLNAFDKNELAAFQKLAEGGEVTHWLNILDKAYGHSVLGHFHRSWSLITRRSTRQAVEKELAEATNLVNPVIPPTPPKDIWESIMARAGAAEGPPAVPRVEDIQSDMKARQKAMRDQRRAKTANIPDAKVVPEP